VTTTELLEGLWRDHVVSTPQAERIRQLLTQRGEILGHERVALRTLAAPGIDIDALARPFEALGWRARDRQRLRDHRLRVRTWQHDDPALPRVEIGEVVIEELSGRAQAILGDLLASAGVPCALDDDFAPPWGWRGLVTHVDYCALRDECEDAAWVAAFGPGVHHFAVDIGSISTFPDLEAVSAFLVEHAFRIEEPAARCRLEGLATRADRVAVELADATVWIPSGHYELAWRTARPPSTSSSTSRRDEVTLADHLRAP
jgi:Domain of unknown function (DUF1338)